MKKKRLTGILALASCVTLLTGCNPDALWGLGKYWNQVADGTVGFFNDIAVKLGLKEAEKKDEKKEEEQKQEGEGEQQHEEEKVPSMVVADLPAKLEVGQELDLDEYVTLENASEYEVVLATASADLASVQGHVLTALGEGTISFTIKCGELSKACTIEGFRGSREALINYFDGVENRYSVVVYQEEQTAGEETPDDETDDEYDWLVADVLFHDTNYILSLGQWDSDEVTGEAIPGGFLRFGEDAEECYTYTLVEDDQGNESVELDRELGLVYFEAYNPSFGVDFAEAEYEYDEQFDLDLYVIEGNDAKWFAEESLLVPGGAFGSQGQYPVDRVEFNIYDEAEEGEPESLAVDAYVYVTFQGQEELVEIATLYTDEESVGYPLLQEYCVAENKPQGVDYWNYFGAYGLGDFFLAEDSLVGQTGLISLDYGWVDDNGDPIDCPEDATTSNLFAYMPVGSKTLLTSPTSIWEVDDTYTPLGGKMLVEGENEGDPDVTYNIFATQTGYYAEEADEGVWDDPTLVFGGLSARSNYAPGSIGSATDITHMEPGENEGDPETEVYDYTVFSFGLGKCAGLIDALIAGDDGLYLLGAIIDAYADIGTNLVNYMSATLVVAPNSGVVSLNISFGWDDNQNWEVNFTSSYYPSVASMTAQYEAYMLANVIAAE